MGAGEPSTGEKRYQRFPHMLIKMKNPVKARLKAGEASIGTWVGIGHPDVTERLADLGFDWLTFDIEHSPLSLETVQTMMQAMSFTSTCVPLARLRWNDPVLIKRVLDMGCYGVIVPWVNSAEEARSAVAACRYPPEGIRGVGPRRAMLRDPDYVKTANDEILVVAMIETQQALDDLDAIFSVPGIDACFIGPWDLSMNLGVGPPPPWEDPAFQDVLKGVVDACERNGIAPGMHCNYDNINMAMNMGFRFCAIDSDAAFMVTGAKEALARVRGWAPLR